MTDFAEFVATHEHFRLVGGPFDGKLVRARGYGCWPSFIHMLTTTGVVARYQMRIGDLEHYDFDRLEDAHGNAVSDVAGRNGK